MPWNAIVLATHSSSSLEDSNFHVKHVHDTKTFAGIDWLFCFSLISSFQSIVLQKSFFLCKITTFLGLQYNDNCCSTNLSIFFCWLGDWIFPILFFCPTTTTTTTTFTIFFRSCDLIQAHMVLGFLQLFHSPDQLEIEIRVGLEGLGRNFVSVKTAF